MTRTRKTALVTGGGSGIGEATVKRLFADGWNVALAGRTQEKLETVANELGAPDRVMTKTCDVSDADEVRELVSAVVEQFGGLDLLVNNAGIGGGGPVDELENETFEKVLAINVTDMFYCIKHAVPHLEETGGSIVNLSSVSGIGGDWGMSPYNAAKGAISNLTRSLALDLAPRGMRINAVAPSLTRTDMATDILADDETMAAFKKRLPMKRPAEPSEIASVIAFLASNDAAYVNGVVLPVDGGLSASNGQPDLRDA